MPRWPITLLTAFSFASLVALGPSRTEADDPQPKPDRPATVRVVAFSSDVKLLVAGYAAADQSGGTIAWDVDTRKPRWHRDTPASVGSLSLAPDGKSLAMVHGKPTALILEPATGKRLAELGPHPVDVRAVAYLPGTDLLATGSDGTIRLWDVTTGKVAKVLKGHPAEVRSLVASPNGKWLVSTGPDTTRIWDVAAGVELKGVILQERGIGHYGITFLGPDRLMIADNSGRQAVRDLPTGKLLMRFSSTGGYDRAAHSETAGLAAFAGYGRPEAAIADLTFRDPTPTEQARIAGVLKDFDDDSYEVRETATAAMKRIGSVAEPALRAAMSDGPSAEVRMRAREVRKVILNEPIRRLTGHTGAVGAMAFSRDGKLFATGAADGMVRIWDPQTAREIARLEVRDGAR